MRYLWLACPTRRIPLGNQILHRPAKVPGSPLPAKTPGADLLILAVQAPQGAAGEENGPTPPRPRQGGLLPKMAHGFGHPHLPRHPAKSQLTRPPVHPTGPGAEGTGPIVHSSHILSTEACQQKEQAGFDFYYTRHISKGQVFSLQGPHSHRAVHVPVTSFSWSMPPCHASAATPGEAMTLPRQYR